MRKISSSKGFSIKEYDIPSALYVNSDQTQVVYAPGDKMTYAEAGSKQIPVVGVEEKRAFTVMVSVLSDGQVLPFQAIYEGKTERALPSKDAPGRRECAELGMQFVSSGTATYWSNQATMKSFVEDNPPQPPSKPEGPVVNRCLLGPPFRGIPQLHEDEPPGYHCLLCSGCAHQLPSPVTLEFSAHSNIQFEDCTTSG